MVNNGVTGTKYLHVMGLSNSLNGYRWVDQPVPTGDPQCKTQESDHEKLSVEDVI